MYHQNDEAYVSYTSSENRQERWNNGLHGGGHRTVPSPLGMFYFGAAEYLSSCPKYSLSLFLSVCVSLSGLQCRSNVRTGWGEQVKLVGCVLPHM